jgi:hypothetical protein
MQRKDTFIAKFSEDDTHVDGEDMMLMVSASTTHIIDKMQKAGKDCNPHCFVFYKKKDSTGGYDTASELTHFLNQLENNKKNLPNNTQLLYHFYSKAAHWTTTLVSIVGGKLRFFILDSADFKRAIKEQIKLIRKISPDATIVPMTLAIQKDLSNCGYYTLDFMDWWLQFPEAVDAILNMPHQTTATTSSSALVLEKAKKSDNPNLFTISRETLLKQPKFGSLFKHTQDLTVITNYKLYLMAPAENYLTSDDKSVYLYFDEKNQLLKYKVDDEIRELEIDETLKDLLQNVYFIHTEAYLHECRKHRLHRAIANRTLLCGQFVTPAIEQATRRGEEEKTGNAKSLFEYFNLRLQEYKNERGDTSIRNLTIDAKRKKFRDRTTEYLKTVTEEQITQLLANRCGENFFTEIARKQNLLTEEKSQENVTQTETLTEKTDVRFKLT